MSTINCPNCGLEIDTALKLERCPVCDALLTDEDKEVTEEEFEEEFFK